MFAVTAQESLLVAFSFWLFSFISVHKTVLELGILCESSGATQEGKERSEIKRVKYQNKHVKQRARAERGLTSER